MATLSTSLRALMAASAVGAAVASLPTAAAEPPPPPPPLPILGAPLAPQGLGGIMAQNGLTPVEPLGTPTLPELNRENLLGQNPVPSAPGGPPGVAPELNAFNNAYLLPQNVAPAAPGEGTVVGVPPGQENADLGRIDYLRQLHELYQNGNLKGSLLGQMPKEQLGQPLPGTAPPPGTNIPSGLYPDLPPAPVPPPAG
jgi:hypothetical protein